MDMLESLGAFDVREYVIERSIVIEAPQSFVFAALTDPGHIVRWWGDADLYRMTDVVHPLRVGAFVRYAGRFAPGVHGGRAFEGVGICRAVDAPRSTEYTRVYPDAIPIAEKTVIRYDLEPRGCGTRVCVTHAEFRSDAAAEMHAAGWERVLGWLDAYVRLRRDVLEDAR